MPTTETEAVTEPVKMKTFLRINDITNVLKLRLENDRGQRLAAFIVSSDKNEESLDMRGSMLVILDGTQSSAEKAYVFESGSYAVDAQEFRKFLHNFPRLKKEQGGATAELSFV